MTSALELEKLVQARETRKFLEEIRDFSKAHADPESRIRIADWFRRIGKYPEALKSLTGFELIPSGSSTDTVEGKIRLQAAHLLNQLGASFSAFQIISLLELKQAEDFRTAGMIALDNFEFHLALDYLETFHRLDSAHESYRSRMTELARADALSGLGKYDQAIAVAEKIRINEHETLLDAIRLQATGEYHARAGKFKEALKYLRASEKRMPADEGTLDSGFLWKWLGYVLTRLGKAAEAQQYFKRAESILCSPTLRIEAYFHFLILKTSVDRKPNVELIQRMFSYPGVAHGFARGIDRILRSELSQLAPVADFGSPGARVQVSADADEFKIGNQWNLGVPLELKLAGALRVAGDWGLSIARTKATFWPDDVYQFFSLDGRVHSLLNRLKTRYKLKTKTLDGIIRFDRKTLTQVRVIYGDGSPSFLRERERFTREEFSRHYGLSATQSKAWLAKWVEQGRIIRNGNGPASFYQRMS